MRIALDAMGGDYAPASIVKGVCECLKSISSDVGLTLVGDEKKIQKELEVNGLTSSSIEIIHAPEIIEMFDSPLTALKKKRKSSITVLATLLKSKHADAIISNGNTGAFMAASVMIPGKIEGVIRPTIGSYIPGKNKPVYLLDVGASVDCKPVHLLQYGLMGSIFVEHLWHRDKPVVGLLSVGEEKSKGNEVTIEAYKLLKKSNLNFAGNIEGRDIFSGDIDVIVCDGFVGNILLKFAETMPSLFKAKMHDLLKNDEFRNAFKEMGQEFNYEKYGGVPLLGVNGVSIVGHGVSTPRAVANAIKTAKQIVDENVTGHIKREILKYQENDDFI